MKTRRHLIVLLVIPLAYFCLLAFVAQDGAVSALLAPSDAAGGLRLLAAVLVVCLRLVCVFVLPAWAAGLGATALHRWAASVTLPPSG